MKGLTSPSRPFVITALGVTQILAWGSSYYLPAVLAPSVVADTGWPLAHVVAGLSVAMLVAGLASPMAGRLIQRYGGRPVLSASSLLFCGALALMASADSYPLHITAWIGMGLGMAGGLYDASFATLGRLYGQDARSAIATLTLFGGFASTVCWPLSALMVDHVGWRGACMAYAGIHLLLGLPLHLFAIPAAAGSGEGATTPTRPEKPVAPVRSKEFLLLAVILMFAATIASMMSVHLLTVLQLRGIELAVAVGLGALIGPSQVGARMLEMLIGRNRQHPIWTMLASAILMAVGLGLLAVSLPLAGLALILYGAGNGIHTIARGALPLSLYGAAAYPAVMGSLAMPSLIAQAGAPFLGAILLGQSETAMLGFLLALATINVAIVALLVRPALGFQAQR